MMNKLFKNLFDFFLSSLGVFSGKKSAQPFYEAMHSKILSGMNYGIPSSDPERSGERVLLRCLREKLVSTKCPVIFDVGANTGQYTREILKAFEGLDLQIFCFEPAGRTFEKLSENLIASKVILENIGFGSSDSHAVLYGAEGYSHLASVYQRRLEPLPIAMSDREDVCIKKIDTFCAERHIAKIDFLKLDTEGHELEVLKGAREMMENDRIQFMQFEFGGCNIDSRTYFRDFYLLLIDKYKIYRIVRDGLFPLSSYREEYEIFSTSNFFAEHR